MQLASGTYSASAVGLFTRPLGHKNWTGVQGEVILGTLSVQVEAVAGNQLSGHEHEDFIDVLGLFGRCLQNREEAVLLGQRAGILKQDVPFFPQITFVPCKREVSKYSVE